MFKRIIILILLNVSLFGNVQNADDIGFVDDITINGREFDSLEQRTIEFYEEDLENGRIVIQGLLESINKNIDEKDLFVEISRNGGKSWNRVTGHKNWEYSFQPVVGFTYEFSLRIMRESSTLNNDNEFPSQFNIAGFVLTLSDNYERIGKTLKGTGSIFVPWLENFGLNGNIDVEFENIGFLEDRIISGSIKYISNMKINYEDIQLDISELIFNANTTKNTLISRLSSRTNFLLSSLPNTDINSLSFNTKGISGTIEYSHNFDFNIWKEQNVKVAFSSFSLDFSLLMTTGLKLDVSNLAASLDFGNLLGSATKTLDIKKDEYNNKLVGIFEWSENSRKKLINNSNIFISKSIGTLNLKDLSNPKIIFNTAFDLSEYSTLFENINEIKSDNIVISKNGLSSSFSTSLNPISIWDEQNVKLNFNGKIGIDLKITSSGLDVDINTGNMEIDFGNLFNSARVELTPIINELGKTVPSSFSWAIVGEKDLKNALNIVLSQLSGELNLSKLSKPEIIFNANANLSAYGGLLSNVRNASITNATISKDGLSAKLGILIDSLDIWKEKRVQLNFPEDNIPSLNLSLSTNGKLDFGFDNLDAQVDFGTLLPDTIATLNSLENGVMSLDFDNSKIIYLLDQKNKLMQLAASLDLSKLENPKISFSSSLELSGYTGILSQIKNLNLTNASISKEGLSATATATLKDINIWAEKKVRLSFSKAPSFSLSISDKLDFSIDNFNASLFFGDLFDGATAQLNALRDDANNIVANTYSWGIDGGKKIVSDAKAVLQNLEGKLSLVDFENPNIIFNADVNLNKYGGTLAKINNAKISNAKISKKGLSAETSLEIEHINIYREKNVKLEFNSNPTLKFSLTTSGYKVGLSDLDASIDFGILIPNATATIQRVLNNSEVEDAISSVEDINNEAQSFIEDNSIYSWDVTGSYALYGDEVSLSTLMGTIDFSSLSNPIISLNANIAFNKTSFLYSYAQNIELLNAKISKNGFSSQIQTQLNDIPIWSEKNVKLDFDENDVQKLSLSVLTSGFKLSLDEFNADLDFGTLIKDAKAEIQTASSGVFTWNLENTQKSLLDTTIALKNLYGSLNLSDISNPIIDINGAINLSTYSSRFESIGDISLIDAKITKSSFKTKLSAQLDDIMIYQEKQVKLVFNNGVSPTFALAVNREGIDFGVENISASIDFGELLGGQILALNKKANSQISALKSNFNNTRNLAKTRVKEIQTKVNGLKEFSSVVKPIQNFDGIYTWNLANSHNFLSDGNGSITVSNIGGEVNLKSLLNPIIDFHTTADFSGYSLEGFSFDALVEVEKATISKSGIEWNLSISNASTDFTVLDLGTKEQDVRVELFNIDASTGSSGSEISSAAGTLFLGNKLFDGVVNPITLAYDGGKYTFSSTQILTYTYQNTILKIVNPTGSIQKINGSYQVAFTGNAQFFTDILKNIGVSNIDLSGLRINSSGFKANLSTTFSPVQEHTLFGNRVSLSLTSIGIKVDSSSNIPIKLNSIDGDVDLSVLFNEAENYAKTSIGFIDSKLTFDFAQKVLHLGSGNKFEFKGLSGAFSMDSLNELSMSINGNFGYKEWENLNLELGNFAISSKGVVGTIGLTNNTKIPTGIENLDINALRINFVDTTNVSGNIGMHYSKNGFLGSSEPLTFDMGAEISLDGVDSFTLDSNALKTIPIENFANMTLKGVTSNLDMDNFSLSFNGLLQPTHTLLSSLSAVEFDGLEISKTGISIDSISSTKTISGASFDLAGMTLTLTELGLGYKVSDELLFFKASGELGLGIAEAGAGMTFYSDGTYNIEQIELNVTEPAIVMSGKFDWYDNDSNYGEGFSATGLNLGIAGIFNVEGAFRIGNKNSSRYWMARALYTSSGGVPLTPIPISLYGFGGGAAYGMDIVRAEGSFESTFVPTGTNNIIVSGLIKMGTSDIGYTWHGTLGVNINLGSGVTTLTGLSYLLSDLSLSPEERTISAEVVLGTSPFEVSIDGGMDIKYLASDFELVHLEGNGAIAYTSARKYVHIGTKVEPISATIFNGPEAQSYLMIESDLFAIGSRFQSNKRWSSWGFGIGYDTEIGFDVEAGFGRRVYIDLQAVMRMAIEARVPIKGWFDLASVDGKVRFRTPSPTMFSLYLRGCAIGKCASHTFYLVGKKLSAADQQNVNILKDIEPYGDSEISLQPIIKVGTFVPNDGTIVNVGDKDYTFSIVNSKFVKTSNPNTGINYYSKRIDEQTIGYMPSNLLSPNTEYKFTAKVQWLSKNNVGTDVLEKTDYIEKIFTTTSETMLPYSEIVKNVSPQPDEKDVSARSKVYIDFSHKAKSLPRVMNNYTPKVIDSKNIELEGTWRNTFYRTNAGRFGERTDTVELPRKEFTPSKPFSTYHFCLNNRTGAIKETVIRSDGKYYNPFRGYSVDGEEVQNINTSNVQNNINSTRELSTSSTYQAQAVSSNGITASSLGITSEVYTDLNLGEPSMANDSFTYYTTNKYMIKVIDESKDRVVYISTFEAKQSGSEGDQFVYVKNNLDNIDTKIEVERANEIIDGQSSRYQATRRNFELRAKSNEFPPCAADQGLGEHAANLGNPMSRTCDTCGDCPAQRELALKRLLVPSANIAKVTLHSGISRSEYPNIFPIIDVVYEDELNPEVTFEKSYRVLYGTTSDNLYQMRFEGIEKIKSATVKYYVAQENTFQTLLNEGRIEPVDTKEIMILDPKLEEVERPEESSGITVVKPSTTVPTAIEINNQGGLMQW